jgi:cytochrome c
MLKPALFALGALGALALGAGAGAASAQGDADAGEGVFKKCKACHTSESGGKNKIGPNLFGIVGRHAGTAPDFKYSPSYLQAGEGGLAWDADTIFAYLADPKAFMREITGDRKAKTRMVFKLKKETDRHNVIAFLETLK